MIQQMRRIDPSSQQFGAPIVGRELELSMLRTQFGQAGASGAMVHGNPGAGKSTLVRAFAALNIDLFPGGVWIEDFADWPEAPSSYREQKPLVDALVEKLADELHPGSRALLILDEAGISHEFLVEDTNTWGPWHDVPLTMTAIRGLARLESRPCFIATSACPVTEGPLSIIGTPRVGATFYAEGSATFSHGGSDLPLGSLKLPLTAVGRPAIRRALLREVGGATRAVREIVKRTGGDVQAAALFLYLLRRGDSADQAIARFEPVEIPGLLDIRGRPIEPTPRILSIGQARIAAVRNELADRLARRPELMRSLTPRQFEEFVADLYAEAGFDVELTPAQSDGGFDVYARQPAPFGSMVTLIECKQYAPHRRVGVGMVRQLAGVVETEQAHAGVLATTATFTSGAQSFAEKYKRIALQDYFNLQDMLMATPRR